MVCDEIAPQSALWHQRPLHAGSPIGLDRRRANHDLRVCSEYAHLLFGQ